MSESRFDLSAGWLCLDFSNTVDWHASSQPKDRLEAYADLISFGKAAGILTDSRAEYLAELAGGRIDDASAAFKEAVHLREAIYRIFSGIADEKEVDPADLEILNKSITQAMSHMKIARSEAGFTWDWYGSSGAFDQIAWPISRSAAELLTSDRLDRLRECADDRGCGMLFLDKSRNGSRRWCSMESCGNRAKANRHYHRTKSGN